MGNAAVVSKSYAMLTEPVTIQVVVFCTSCFFRQKVKAAVFRPGTLFTVRAISRPQSWGWKMFAEVVVAGPPVALAWREVKVMRLGFEALM